MKRPRPFSALIAAALVVALSQLIGAASAGARISIAPSASFAFSAIAYSAGEAAGPATITISRSGSTVASASVRFATSHGTATAGADYTEVSQTVTFLPGESSETVSIPIVDDALPEGDETVQLALSSPSAGTMLGYPSTATLTILDDERAFRFAWNVYFAAENDGVVYIEVDRIGPGTGTDTVRFATEDATAKAGLDYVATNQLVSFAPGESVKLIPVTILNDSVVEGSDVLRLTLASPSAGIVLTDPSLAQLTIFDDDTAPPAKPKPSGKIASAHLTKTSFTSVQVATVKLVYSFSPKSTRFGYQLSMRQNSTWRIVHSASKKGIFAGSKKMTVKQLFGSKSVVSGRYRLKLIADKNSRLLTFTVT